MQQPPSMDTLDLVAAVLYAVEFLSRAPMARPGSDPMALIRDFLDVRAVLRQQYALYYHLQARPQSDAPQRQRRPARG